MARTFRPFTPAEGPSWLVRFADSIAGLFRQIMPAPFRLKEYATADLPTAADWTQGLVYDTDNDAPSFSDGTSWVRLSAYDADVAAIAALSTTGILCRTGSDSWVLRSITGTANEITVTNGGGVLGAPTLSLPAAMTFTGKTVTGGTFTNITLGGTATFGTDCTLGPNGIDIAAGKRIVSPSFRLEAATPIITLKDTDNTSTSHTGYLNWWDSSSTTLAELGFRSTGGTFSIDNKVGSVIIRQNGTTVGTFTTSGTAGLDVTGQLRCDSFRLDQNPVAQTITCTHTISFSVNGTNYVVPCKVE